jgi:hypothetical protein
MPTRVLSIVRELLASNRMDLTKSVRPLSRQASYLNRSFPRILLSHPKLIGRSRFLLRNFLIKHLRIRNHKQSNEDINHDLRSLSTD